MKRVATVLLVFLVLSLALPMHASAYRGWAAGEWRLIQYFSDNGREMTFTGTLNIHREGNMVVGRILFDVLGTWEPIDYIEITDDTLQFTRTMYHQRFVGRFDGNTLTGTYTDNIHHGEWQWRAERN